MLFILNVLILVYTPSRVFQLKLMGRGNPPSGEILLGWFFHQVVGTRQGVILTILTFFKAKSLIKIKISMTCDYKKFFQMALRGRGEDGGRDGKFCWWEFFYWLARIWREVILIIRTFSKAKTNILEILNID